MPLPAEAQPLVAVLLPHLSRPTYTRDGPWPTCPAPSATRPPGTDTVTFADALTAARRRIRADGALREAKGDGAIAELPADVRELLLSGLAPAP